jgi:hypothetical protein
VSVTGQDGAGHTRVLATANVDNLRAGAPPLELKATDTSPVLVINRSLLLGTSQLSDITHMTVETVGPGKATLVDFVPGPYFQVESGAYGVPNVLSDGLPISAQLSTAQMALQRVRLTAKWNVRGYYEAQ